LLSCTPSYVAILVKEKSKAGVLLESLKENVDRPLSAILTLNTLTHTLGSAAIAYQVQHLYGDNAVTIASIIFTFVVLIFSEILPKSIAAANWRTLAPVAAYMMQALVVILYPIVRFSELINNLVKKEDDSPEVSREDLLATAEIGAEEGTIKNKETMIIKNLLMLDKIYVSDIMTPRSVFFALPDDMNVGEVFEKYKPIRFSRIPVFHDNLDSIIGLTLRYRIHEAVSSDQHQKPLADLLSPVSSIPERMTVQSVLDFFIRGKEHLAIAVDEYGIVTGLVTLEDAIETLLGVEIVDELDNVEDMRKYALEQWQLRKQKGRRS
jgi:CBS domain containing-hemolysin-like protein